MITCRICDKEFDNIKELTKHLINEHKYSLEQVYSYYNYSFENGKAVCPVCGKEFIMTKRQISGFKKNKNKSIGCCTACSKSIIMMSHGSPLANPEIYKKTKETLKRNYGVEHPMYSEKIKDTLKKTNLKKYGVENVFQSPEIQRKRKDTNLEKYGVEEAIGSKEVRDKAKETLKEHYGVENAFQSEEIKERIKKKHLKTFGVEHPMKSSEVQNKMKKTNLKNTGAEFPLQTEKSMNKMKSTNLKKIGVEYTWQSEEIQKKRENSMMNKYGVAYPMQSKEIQEQTKKTNMKKRGVEYVLQDKDVREKGKEKLLEKYGVEYFCQHENCYKNNFSRISKVNKKFQEFLFENKIESELEFILEDSGYDLKVGNIVIEINPWFTHNSTIGPRFGDKVIEPKPIDYHLQKTNIAKEHGFHCIHVFDWDEWDKIISLLSERKRIYARECEVRQIGNKVAKQFLEDYHLQGSTRQIKYAYGLYYKDELIQVMTFGKPRYNKKYEYELLRLCTVSGISVVGGAGKLLKYFEENVKPKSLISYCDLSKFNGEVYTNIGFHLEEHTIPARHWYNPKTKRHITDNLLRQRGFDQLHGANFGKGTSNEQLMIEHGYVEIYDCGQLVFVKLY